MYTFFTEALKIILTIGFLYLFVHYFKKAINIAKTANPYLTKNFQIDENNQQKAVKKTLFKFLFFKNFNEIDIHNFLNDLSISERYLSNQNK